MNNGNKKKGRIDFAHIAPLLLSDVACPFKSISSESAARWTAPVWAKGYFLEGGEVVTNYEQLITLRCHFVTQWNLIKRAADLWGESGEALTPLCRITINFPEHRNIINTLAPFRFEGVVMFLLMWRCCSRRHFPGLLRVLLSAQQSPAVALLATHQQQSV